MIRHLCTAVLVLLPTTALAQGNPGPFGGFFGRTPERNGRDFTVLDLRTSSGVQYDEPMLDPNPALPQQRGGPLLGASGQLRFETKSDRLRLQLRSTGVFHYFMQAPAVGGTTIDNRFTVEGKPATRLQLDASVAHTYQPFFNYEQVPMLFERGVVPPTARYIARGVESHSGEGIAGFTSYYAKNSSLSASVSRRETRFVQNRDLDFTMNGARGGWRRQLTRDLALKLEYGREHYDMRAGEESDRLFETIDAGIDFTRGLSLTRNTTFQIRTQTAIVRQPPYGRFYRLNGGASVDHLFRRTWRVTVRADRQTNFVAGFVEPLNGDTVGMQLAGLLSRRTELVLQADGGRGQFGFVDVARGGFTMGTAIAQINYALTRHLGLFAQHGFLYYEWPAAASPVAPGDKQARQFLTVGITTWIPIHLRERSPSDSR